MLQDLAPVIESVSHLSLTSHHNFLNEFGHVESYLWKNQFCRTHKLSMLICKILWNLALNFVCHNVEGQMLKAQWSCQWPFQGWLALHALYHHRPGPEDRGQGGEGERPDQRAHQEIRSEVQVRRSGKFDGTFSAKVTKALRRNKVEDRAQEYLDASTSRIFLHRKFFHIDNI